MDYLASEISMQTDALNKISDSLINLNLPKVKEHRRSPLQSSFENKVLANKFLVDDICEIPPYTFEFNCVQEISKLDNSKEKWRRYELKLPVYKSMSYYLVLAYCIIKKNLRIDRNEPTEISIGFEKGELMDNEINIHLSKENINESSILKFANIIDYLDLELSFFILWTDFKASEKPKRRAISGTTRQNVLMRDNYTCQICGATVKTGATLEIDHIIPVSKGGTNDESNLQVLCQRCNREKHNREDLLHDKLKLAELEGK